MAEAAVPAPGIALPSRRRKTRSSSSPLSRPARKTVARARQGNPGLALRTFESLSNLSGSALLDRLIRGRLWIGLLAFALIGIVAMQLLVLKLNTGIGRTLAQVATLQRENAQLGIEDSSYSAENRVASLAAVTDMKPAAAGAIHFVAASKADIARAASVLSTAPSGLAEANPATSSSSASAAEAGSETPTSSQPPSGASGQAPASGETPASSESSSSTATAASQADSEATSSTTSASAPLATSGSATGSSTPTPSADPSTAPQVAGATVAPSSANAGQQAEGSGSGAQTGARE